MNKRSSRPTSSPKLPPGADIDGADDDMAELGQMLTEALTICPAAEPASAKAAIQPVRTSIGTTANIARKPI